MSGTAFGDPPLKHVIVADLSKTWRGQTTTLLFLHNYVTTMR